MATTTIGTVKSGKSYKVYDVRWNDQSHEVFVSYAGGTRVGTASSAGDAMRKAEAWLYDK